MKNPEQNTDSLNEEEKTITETVERGDEQTLTLTKREEDIKGLDLLVTTSIVVTNKNGESVAIEGNEFIPEGWRLIDGKDIKDQKKEDIPENLKDSWISSRKREDIELNLIRKLTGWADLKLELIVFSADTHKGSMYALLHELGHAHFSKNNPTKINRHKEIAEQLNSVKDIAKIPINIRQELLAIIMENEFQANLWAIKTYKLIQSEYNIDLEPDLTDEELLINIIDKGYWSTIKKLKEKLQIDVPEDIDLNFLIEAKKILDLD